jgi:hypothetical protein
VASFSAFFCLPGVIEMLPFKDVLKKRIDVSNKEVFPAEIIVSIHKDLN